MTEGTAPVVTLDLTVEPAVAARLFRHPAIAVRRHGQAHRTDAAIVFHDTAEGALAEAGLAFTVASRGRRTVQRLVRTLPAPGEHVVPAVALPALAESRGGGPSPDAAAFAGMLPGPAEGQPLAAIAAMRGRRATLRLTGGMEAALTTGVLGGVTATCPVARLSLSAPEAALADAFGLLRSLAADGLIAVPAAAPAEEARALAHGTAARPLWRGAPDLAGAATVEEGARRAIGQLTLALLAAAPVAAEGSDPEGVHQARVAIRRLRSALTLFRPAIACPAADTMKDRLGALARTLGAARDWDVFIAGSLAEANAAFPDEAALARLARAARTARAAAYTAVRATLAGAEFRLLGLDLAAAVALPPWRETDDAAAAARQAAPLEAFAAAALARRHRRLRRAGDDFAGLDIPGLHTLRIQAKRMRYAGELFGGLYGAKRRRRFQKAVAALQDALGHLNDTAVAAGLLAAVATRGPGGGRAAGIVQGWVAAKAAHARENARAAWDRLMDRPPFWND